ncbi:hypothetical protein C8Q79DRAFT_1014656 [Trametes meyenii]|nr:hypothetical protein C8Q79DRAFT_1014656 [Trametes meyenii]
MALGVALHPVLLLFATRSMKSFALLSCLSYVLAASAISLGNVATVATECKDETVAAETYIGEAKDVKVTYSHCGSVPLVNAEGEVVSSLTKRQDPVNVCGAPCNTFCFNPSGGGPNEDDCKVIADALLFDSQSIGPLFNITAFNTPTGKITMQYQSCLTYFLNQDSSELEYCRNDWSSLVTWLASDCNAANNAHGGLCVAQDQRWYIQVQHSP